MISVQSLVSRLESATDSEGFDHYTFGRDWRYAIDYGVEFCTQVLDRILGKTRFTEERLSDLLYTGIWKTNAFSRFEFNETAVGQKLWAIVAIYPNPVIEPNTAVAQPNLNLSVYSNAHSFIKGYKSAWRVTSEEVSINRKNPFAPGNEYHDECEELAEYGYLSPVNYGGGYHTPATMKEITITPYYVNKVLAMQYISYPEPVTAITDNVAFPTSMTNMIVEAALNFITWKRGDSNLTQITDTDIKQLTSLLV